MRHNGSSLVSHTIPFCPGELSSTVQSRGRPSSKSTGGPLQTMLAAAVVKDRVAEKALVPQTLVAATRQ